MFILAKKFGKIVDGAPKRSRIVILKIEQHTQTATVCMFTNKVSQHVVEVKVLSVSLMCR